MFSEANAVQAYLLEILTKDNRTQVAEASATYEPDDGARQRGSAKWRCVEPRNLPRFEAEVLVESWLREALIRINPEIAAQPSRADDVLYRLRALLLSVRTDGLVRANEEFTAWLRGERSLPVGPNNEHVPIKLIDFENLSNNDFVVTIEWTYNNPSPEKRFDLVLLVNGMPLVIGEAKTPVRPAVTWVDGADQILNDYEQNVPAMFVPNVFSFATEGKAFRFGSIRMPLELWAPWREIDGEAQPIYSGLSAVKVAVKSLLRPEVVLDILRSFTLFATDRQHRKIKVICRYQQYQAVNQIVDRVVGGAIKKGLIWHFQGSGKSLLMVFAAQKLRMDPALRNPTVLIVVDRIDLDAQITATFNASDIPNMVAADDRQELERLLRTDARKVIITTIHKFAEAEGVLNDRENIIVLVDEAHRTQEGDLGRKMREALPNAFLFGLTGTPINKRDRNTFWAFGAEEDDQGYLSRYSFEESIRDGATLPIHFEARLVEHRVDREAVDQAFAAITGHLSEADQTALVQRATQLGVLLKNPDHVARVAEDIVRHFQEKIEPNGFKAQVVVFDRAACVLYKEAFDRLLPPEASDIVMTVGRGEDAWRAFDHTRDEEEKLLDRFRDPADPLKILIVTQKLLTGFDAPILQAMYLNKPMKEHNLLQAICRVNRPREGKGHGLVVDYLGIFDDVAATLDFDEASVQRVIANIEQLKAQVAQAMNACLAHFPGVDRSIVGYEGLLAAQDRLPTDAARDVFASHYSVLHRLWETLSPDPVLLPYAIDYRWLGQVYESIKPPSGHGKLLWHALGAKTIELINENVHVGTIRGDLETLVLDEDLLVGVLGGNGSRKTKEVEIKIAARLRGHAGDPTFLILGERLEELRNRHEAGLLTSLNFLKQLLELAKDVLAAEKQADPQEEIDRGKAALTELFSEVRNGDTPVIVERIVGDIDAIVRSVRFPGWQRTTGGERDVRKAVRGTLLKYKLHQDQDLFDRAYGYIEQYY